MGKADEKKGQEESKDGTLSDPAPPVVAERAVAEPKIPFMEFSQTQGLNAVLLAGFQAHCTRKQEPTHRTQANWLAAYKAFAAMPA